ncbi:MAG: hypothetical protein AAF125_07190 [Chloroflexota bacterium]
MTVRVVLRMIWVPLIVLIVTVAVIRARPFTPSVTLAALHPGDCVAPCVLAIVPGETIQYDALATLDDHPDVLTFTLYGTRRSIGWRWTPAAPPEFDRGGQITFEIDGAVEMVRLPLHTSLADARLAYGPPEASYYRAHTVSGAPGITVYDVYAGGRFVVQYGGACEPRYRAGWLVDDVDVIAMAPGAVGVLPNVTPLNGRVEAGGCHF